jgi:hypothetical protein
MIFMVLWFHLHNPHPLPHVEPIKVCANTACQRGPIR